MVGHAQEDVEEGHTPQTHADREPVTDVYDNEHHKLNESRVDDLMAQTMHDAVNNLEAQPDRTRYRQPAGVTNTEAANSENIKDSKSNILHKIEKQREEKVKAMEESLQQLQEQEERQASAITSTIEQFNKNT